MPVEETVSETKAMKLGLSWLRAFVLSVPSATLAIRLLNLPIAKIDGRFHEFMVFDDSLKKFLHLLKQLFVVAVEIHIVRLGLNVREAVGVILHL